MWPSGGKLRSSDHDLICFELRCFSNHHGSDKTVLDFGKANFNRAKELLTIDWAARLSHLGLLRHGAFSGMLFLIQLSYVSH